MMFVIFTQLPILAISATFLNNSFYKFLKGRRNPHIYSCAKHRGDFLLNSEYAFCEYGGFMNILTNER